MQRGLRPFLLVQTAAGCARDLAMTFCEDGTDGRQVVMKRPDLDNPEGKLGLYGSGK
jgi:hypothetical protein